MKSERTQIHFFSNVFAAVHCPWIIRPLMVIVMMMNDNGDHDLY